MPTTLLYNPAAGRGRARAVKDRVVRAAARVWPDLDVRETEAPGDGVLLARRAAEQGAERLLVIGGDGTVHEAANGILAAGGTLPPLGVIPCGTGNDFAKMVGTVRCSPEEAVRRLAGASVRRFDTGQAWGERFVNSLGIGLDADVALELRSVRRLRGTPAYALALLRTLSRLRPRTLEVEAGDERWTGDWTAVVVGNGPVEGGSFRLTPAAVPDDGKLDLCAVSALRLGRLLRLLPTLFWGGHGRFPEVRLRRLTSLAVRAPGHRLMAHLDGEIRAPGTDRIEVVVHPASLPVLVAPR
ncbi:MAG TPA: diacylglycerol kinase family protein [Gemmatimonadales bacterium]|nr:diacylglycerol kinase family protein [Gemmatimonadales bacterium]